MLLLLCMTVFLAAGATANKVAGKFQALFFYQLYRLEVDAHGLDDSRMAPGCAKNGVVCNMEAFINEICKVTRKPEKDASGNIIRGPKGQPILIKDPDFDKVNWALIGEGADLEVISTEFDKAGFKGDMNNAKIFKDWKQKNSFETVMSEAEDIAMKAIAKLKADGREPADDRFNKMTAALKTHADARRYDQAQRISAEFAKFMKGKGFSAAYTDPIERPPVPGYKKIDADQTISDNEGRVGFDKIEQEVRDYVTNQNSGKESRSHVEAIFRAQGMHDHLAEACRAA
ncbi:hypothetical protein BDV37DRAFT_282436 [Aspergillus pseudonomiae]|uniref:Uncharacterized protein n=1 Tax=Aspergillus pseudonomiae TaxID=1506151 RepID=A0A5N7DFV1_9EURO|nr:uncharacterized protein BDV37DRAFT_282436 [Aspergillus pseudonomiae]KAE8404903.1 hypothetical protein BDV37DRAFT_282436 [Aspergillus pseudonomiae]